MEKSGKRENEKGIRLSANAFSNKQPGDREATSGK
jgi:hypothetical protein